MKFFSENVPQELKEKDQWVCYKIDRGKDKVGKYMIDCKTTMFAKSNNSSTWCDFETAERFMKRRNMDGIAFVLTEGYVFIDIDHAIDENGNYNELAQNLLNDLPGTYAEKSCSGRGIHIICKGDLGEDYKRRNDYIGLEMYQNKRFLCITGDIIDNRKEILDYSNIIKKINIKYLGEKPKKVEILRTTPTMSDKTIIDKIRQSKNRDKFDELYSGNISNYPSHSNADFAFIRLLVFWTQDRNQLDSIFRSSGLYREKWDKKIGDSTYGEITIDNALKSQTNTYKVSKYEMY